jgi:hypothetical protein
MDHCGQCGPFKLQERDFKMKGKDKINLSLCKPWMHQEGKYVKLQ